MKSSHHVLRYLYTFVFVCLTREIKKIGQWGAVTTATGVLPSMEENPTPIITTPDACGDNGGGFYNSVPLGHVCLHGDGLPSAGNGDDVIAFTNLTQFSHTETFPLIPTTFLCFCLKTLIYVEKQQTVNVQHNKIFFSPKWKSRVTVVLMWNMQGNYCNQLMECKQ